MASRRQVLGVFLLLIAAPAAAEMPYPPNPAPCTVEGEGPCIDARDFQRYLFLPAQEPPLLPDDLAADDWKLTSAKTGEAAIDGSAQELFGVKGASVERAWQITTGRPDVVIAVLDSGIRWDEPQPDLVNKFYLNRGELPAPEGSTNSRDRWDRNGDGFFTVRDYLAAAGFAQDSRVSDQNGNGIIDPEDLIFLFSDGSDADQNGYVDDISGWDFLEDDNDPLDEVHYGHGTGESHDSSAEANNGTGGVGTCPNCLLLEVRVGDSFVTDVNLFAQGVVFAVDGGAKLVQEALGTLNQTAFGQAAVDYAWRNGVLVVASAADEESNHHNYPASYNHTLEVNSVTRFFSESGIEQSPRSYLYLNGCTNYGGHIHLAVPSSSCSSEATGLSSGIAALAISAAQNAVAAGMLQPYERDDGSSAPYPLSAEELRQILIATADDVNFDARDDVDPAEPQNYVTRLPVPGTQQNSRFPSIAGWDQYFGYGRIDAARAVERVASGDIPPEAAIESPAWFEIIDPGPDEGRGVDALVRGRVAANRAADYHFDVWAAPGVQPAESDLVLVATDGPQRTQAVEGDLIRFPLAGIVARMPHGVTGPAVDETGKPDPDRFGITIRLRVVDDQGRVAEDRRVLALHSDPDLYRTSSAQAVTRKFDSDGVSAPATADLDGDAREEIILGTSAGAVHALRAMNAPDPPKRRLAELSGWPVMTDPLEIHEGSRAFTSGAIGTPVYGAIIGPIVVGDLDRDGNLEVGAADMQGKVYAWNRDGSRRAGFPVQTLAAYSNTRRSERDPDTPDGRVPDRTNRHDRDNAVARGIVGGLALGNLDASTDGSLEIVAAALDRHVYAWHADGTAVAGWPVLVKDPAKVASVDPITDEVTMKPDSGAAEGTKLVAAPSLGDLDGDETLDVVTVANEAYDEETNAVFGNIFINIFIGAGILDPGNTRVHAIHSDGAAHGAAPLARGWNPDAFLSGWPVKTSLLVPELLPFVGEGSNGPPALADVDGDGKLEVATFSAVGPAYLFRADGTPYFGETAGVAKTFDGDALGAHSNSTDLPSFGTLGAPVLAEFAGKGQGFHLLAPATGLGKFLDNQLPARQWPADNYLAAWSVGGERAGRMLDAFPRVVNDLQFFSSPAIADLDGDGKPEAIEGSGVYDLHAFDIDGVEPAGWPKFTGGWMIGSPAVGDLDGDGLLEVVALTREGNLFVWKTQGSECSVLWRRWHHDEWGTGNYHADTRPPAPLHLFLPGVSLDESQWEIGLLYEPKDDLVCGDRAEVDVRYSSERIETTEQFLAADAVEGAEVLGTSLVVTDRRPLGAVHLAGIAVDDAGNRSPIGDLGTIAFATPVPTATATLAPSATASPTSTLAPSATATAASSGGGCSMGGGSEPTTWCLPLLAALVAMGGRVATRQRRCTALHQTH